MLCIFDHNKEEFIKKTKNNPTLSALWPPPAPLTSPCLCLAHPSADTLAWVPLEHATLGHCSCSCFFWMDTPSGLCVNALLSLITLYKIATPTATLWSLFPLLFYTPSPSAITMLYPYLFSGCDLFCSIKCKLHEELCLFLLVLYSQYLDLCLADKHPVAIFGICE